MKVYEIIPGKLYQRGSISDVKNLYQELKDLGIKTVINVRTKKDWIINHDDLYYAHYPLPDGKNVPYTEAEKVAAFATLRIQNGYPVLVYCNAGRNRSSFVNALIMRRLGYDIKDAVTHIRKVRPGAFGSNEGYAEYLEAL